MNPETVRNWITKAEHDFQIGSNEMKVADPATDMVCFHMQQCAEKYLKAFLAFKDAEIRRTHDLAVLLKDCSALDDSFITLLEKRVPLLTPYGTVIRYPDDFYMPSVEEAKETVELARMVKNFVRDRLISAGFKWT